MMDDEFAKTYNLIANENVNLILSTNEDSVGANLYLGGITATKNESFMSNYKIGSVVSVIVEEKMEFPDYIDHLLIEVFDEGNVSLYQYFPNAYDFIEKNLSQGKNVLVHCFAGMMRSATIVISYIMKKFNKTFKEASDFVKNKRKLVRISNKNFVDDLKNYEIDLTNK